VRSGPAIMAILAAGVALLFRSATTGALVDSWLDVGPENSAPSSSTCRSRPPDAYADRADSPCSRPPCNFFPGLRAKYPQSASLVGPRLCRGFAWLPVLGGWQLRPMRPAGPVAGLGFGILAVLWVRLRHLAPGAPLCSANSRSIAC